MGINCPAAVFDGWEWRGRTKKVRLITDEYRDYEFNTKLGSAIWHMFDCKRLPYSLTEIRQFMYEPMLYNKEIRDLCWWCYNESGVITNVVDYMCALPTLDRIVYTKDKKKRAYEKERKIFLRALERMRVNEMIRDSILKNCNDGVSFYYLTEEEPGGIPHGIPARMSAYTAEEIVSLNAGNETNYSLKPLPVDYCKIVGIKNASYQIAFDLSYFKDMDLDRKAFILKAYPKEIRDGALAYLRDKNKGLEWLTLDNTKTIVTKIRAKREEPWGRPIALAALDDILYRNYYVDTKRGTLDQINNRLIYEEFPEGKEKGTSSLTSDQQREQHEVIKAALNNRQEGKWSVAFVSLASGSKLSALDINADIFKDKNEENLFDEIAGDVGFAASLLNGTSKGTYASQQSNLALIGAEIFTWIEQFQTELNKVINANIIKDASCFTEVSFLPITLANRKEMTAHIKDLYMNGKGSFQAWVTAVGLPYEAYLGMMDQELDEDLENKYPVHKTSYTLSGGKPDAAQPGRPQEESPMNENTIISKANGANEQPKAGTG